MKKLSIPLFILLLLPSFVSAATSVSQNEITWHFDDDYQVGQFVNGDYWVLGPVTITRIEPDYDGSNNGWEVNPSVGTAHGFQSITPGFDQNLVPSLPYTSQSPIESIVKVVTCATGSQCRNAGYNSKFAAVLTVVDEIPPGGGSLVFRPPYVGTNKPMYAVSSLRSDLLPSYTPIGNPPTFATIIDNYQNLRLDHLLNSACRPLRPWDAMRDYQPENTPAMNNAILRFMLDDSYEDKLPALKVFLQHGIDKLGAFAYGWEQPSGGGHNPGHRIDMAFAATMLDLVDVKNDLMTATGFHEDSVGGYLKDGLNSDVPLWGQTGSTEENYWNYIRIGSGSRSHSDPYGFIDGGTCGEAYQFIVAQAWKGEALSTILMPSLQTAWNPTEFERFSAYVDRWVEHGTWASPDPCAPHGGGYGVDYGPDPQNPGMCILDPDLDYYNSPTDFECQTGSECGRYPEKHGASTDDGQYRSEFVVAMWDAYRYISIEPCTDQGFICCSSDSECSNPRTGSGCGSGEQCCATAGDCTPCTTHDYSQCYNGDRWWYDSCNNREDIRESCANGCSSDTCIIAQTCQELTGSGWDCCDSGEICQGTSYSGASDCSGTCCSQTCQSSPSPSGDVMLWLPFDNGQITDMSGNGITVTSYGDPSPAADKDGNANSALHFDGDDYLDVGTGDFGITNEFTLAVWMNAESNIANHNTIIKRGQYIHPFSMLLYDDDTVRTSIRTDSIVHLYSDALNLNTWYHVALTFDNNELVVYLNGEENDRGSSSGSFVMESDYLTTIGAAASEIEFFNGTMDDIRIYNSALTQPEIQALYDGQQQTYHRADINTNCVIETTELMTFMQRWRVSIADVGMVEMMEAIELWKSGVGCS